MRPGRTDKQDMITRHNMAAVSLVEKASRHIADAIEDESLTNPLVLRPIVDLLTQAIGHRVVAFVAQDRKDRMEKQ